jgi:hypothetical protein
MVTRKRTDNILTLQEVSDRAILFSVWMGMWLGITFTISLMIKGISFIIG